MTDLIDLANDIAASDMVFGRLALESIYCHNNRYDTAALSCIFVLCEAAIKRSLNETRGNFSRSIQQATKAGIISEEERLMLNCVRDIRNKLFHEDHYSCILEFGGLFWQLSEDDTKFEIYNMLSEPVFKLILKI
jgi:hypothetical protein